MLFRDFDGNLIQLNRYDFKNDKLYYKKIMEIKQQSTKSNKDTNKNEYINYSNYVINNTLKEK